MIEISLLSRRAQENKSCNSGGGLLAMESEYA
jgi:hypothetical protein